MSEPRPHCGCPTDESQRPDALPLRTMLQNQYMIGSARRSNGEGVSYIGCNSALDIKTSIRGFFSQMMNKRLPDSQTVRVVDGSEVMFQERETSFLNNARELAHMRQLSATEQIYDVFEENGAAYTVAEWGEYITLCYPVECRGDSLDWSTVCPLLMPVLSTFSILHSKGINHLGISSDTLVILQDGYMKLTDFELDAVRRMDIDLPPDLVVSYAALKQYMMDYVLDKSTDVYGFAVCLFFTLTGALP